MQRGRGGRGGKDGEREGDLMTKNANQFTSLCHKVHTQSICCFDIYWHSHYMSSVTHMTKTDLQNITNLAWKVFPYQTSKQFN